MLRLLAVGNRRPRIPGGRLPHAFLEPHLGEEDGDELVTLEAYSR
jgi:hypothetical protein